MRDVTAKSAILEGLVWPSSAQACLSSVLHFHPLHSNLVVAQCCARIIRAFPALNTRSASSPDEWLARLTGTASIGGRCAVRRPSVATIITASPIRSGLSFAFGDAGDQSPVLVVHRIAASRNGGLSPMTIRLECQT